MKDSPQRCNCRCRSSRRSHLRKILRRGNARQGNCWIPERQVTEPIDVQCCRTCNVVVEVPVIAKVRCARTRCYKITGVVVAPLNPCFEYSLIRSRRGGIVHRISLNRIEVVCRVDGSVQLHIELSSASRHSSTLHLADRGIARIAVAIRRKYK